MKTYEAQLKDLAKLLIGVAKSIPKSDRVGDHLVYIIDVHSEMALNGVAMRLSDFKIMLVEAYRRDMITLAKGDLPSALNQTKYKQSLTEDRNTLFTFIRV